MSDGARTAELERLEALLGYAFADASLLERALTHSSWANQQQDGSRDYERLEFLGDALIDLVVAEWLWRDDASAREGVLSKRRQTVVMAQTLADAGSQLGLGRALRLSHGEEATGGRSKPSILADAFEAVVGAIYVDGGYPPAAEFIQRHLAPALEATREITGPATDWKTMLQEKVQGKLKTTPSYRIVAEEGPPHERVFEVAVRIGEEEVAVGRGASRKEAEQQAAERAFERWPVQEWTSDEA